MIRTQISVDKSLYQRAKRTISRRGVSLAELCRQGLEKSWQETHPISFRWSWPKYSRESRKTAPHLTANFTGRNILEPQSLPGFRHFRRFPQQPESFARTSGSPVPGAYAPMDNLHPGHIRDLLLVPTPPRGGTGTPIPPADSEPGRIGPIADDRWAQRRGSKKIGSIPGLQADQC